MFFYIFSSILKPIFNQNGLTILIFKYLLVQILYLIQLVLEGLKILLLFMNSSKRQSRWMQIGFDRTNSHHKSKDSSQRYHPMRSPYGSQKDFTLQHFNSVQNISGLPHLSNQQIKDSNNKDCTKINLSGSKKISQDMPHISQHRIYSPTSSRHRIPKDHKILHKKTSINRMIQNKKEPLEDHLRDYIKIIKNIQINFQNQKIQVTNKLDAQQKQIEDIKNAIMKKFHRNLSSFQDPTLKKVIIKYHDNQIGDHHLTQNSISFMNASKEILNQPLQKSHIHTKFRMKTGEASQVSFNRVFQTIKMIKRGLDQFKEIHTSIPKNRQRRVSFSLKKNIT